MNMNMLWHIIAPIIAKETALHLQFLRELRKAPPIDEMLFDY